ncbi:hypothetical protein D3C86_1652800 [compost metagenome]
MVREFELWGVNVVVADSWADPDELIREHGIKLNEIGRDSPVDVLVVAVGHSEYRSFSIEELRAFCRGDAPILVDVKSLFNKSEAENSGFEVFRL